jgi:hypothetical protein
MWVMTSVSTVGQAVSEEIESRRGRKKNAPRATEELLAVGRMIGV